MGFGGLLAISCLSQITNVEREREGGIHSVQSVYIREHATFFMIIIKTPFLNWPLHTQQSTTRDELLDVTQEKGFSLFSLTKRPRCSLSAHLHRLGEKGICMEIGQQLQIKITQRNSKDLKKKRTTKSKSSRVSEGTNKNSFNSHSLFES